MRLYPQYSSWENTKDPERSLVVGYISPDYFTHSVSYFIEAPLTHHDYQNYKVVVYSSVVKVYIFLDRHITLKDASCLVSRLAALVCIFCMVSMDNVHLTCVCNLDVQIFLVFLP